MPMLLVSGLIADVDWTMRLVGASAFLHGHRTATHSLVGTLFLVLTVTGVSWIAGRTYPKFQVGFLSALIICTLGAGTHLLLDMLNSYGVNLLWPFSSKWFALDLAPPADWWIIVFLLAGLLLPELLRLIHEEIGSKPMRGRQRGAIVGLILVSLFVAGRGLAHQRALTILDSREYRGQAPVRVAAFPKPATPLVWLGVMETDNAILNIDVTLTPGSAFDPDQAEVHFKPQDSSALKSAVESQVAKDFLNFARFPLAGVAPKDGGYNVRLQDMRFASEIPKRQGIVAVIDLNARNQVVRQRLEFASSGGN